MLQIRRSGAGAGAGGAPRTAASARAASAQASVPRARANATASSSRRASADDDQAPLPPLPPSRPQSRPQSSAGHEADPSTHLMTDLAKAAMSSAVAAVISAAPAHGAAAAAVVAALPPPPTADALVTPFSAVGRELMIEGALHVSGPQLGSCLQRFGSSLQKAVAEPAPTLSSPARHGSLGGLSSPRQRSLAQEEAVCLATPTEPAPVREQRLPTLPRMPTVANNTSSTNSALAEQIFIWRSASDSAEGALANGGGGPAASASSSPIAAAVRRLSRRAGLSASGARALLEEAVGAGASYDAADDEAELVACRRTVASIAARVGAAHATRRERRRLVVRARLAARGLLTGLVPAGGGAGGGSGGGGDASA